MLNPLQFQQSGSGSFASGVESASIPSSLLFQADRAFALRALLLSLAVFLGPFHIRSAGAQDVLSLNPNREHSVFETNLDGLVIEVLRSGTGAETVQVDYIVKGFTAIANTDFIPDSGTLVFPPGVFSRTFLFRPVNDFIAESNELAVVQITKPSTNAQLGAFRTLSILIEDDDGSRLYFAGSDKTVHEADGFVECEVIRTPPLDSTVTVHVVTEDGTAMAGSDYVAANIVLTFLPGETNKKCSIQLLTDLVSESQEYFTVRLESPTGLAQVGDGPEFVTVDVLGDPPSAVSCFDETGLRQALGRTNALTFHCGGTILLTSPIVVSNSITLDGGDRMVTLDGGRRPYYTLVSQLFKVTPTGRLTLKNITLTNGMGPAVYNDHGTVLLDGVTLGNNGIAWPGGGAIYCNDGVVSARNCLFVSNVCDNWIGRPSSGGAVYGTTNADLSFEDCLFFGNRCHASEGVDARGGAIRSQGRLSLRRCLFAGNTAQGGEGATLYILGRNQGSDARGGALSAEGLTVAIDCSFVTNWAVGGPGAPPAYETVDSGGRGGQALGSAIYAEGMFTLLNSAVWANTGSGGAGGRGADGYDTDCCGYPATTGGAAGAAVGAIFSQGAHAQLFVTNCTIALNTLIGGDGGNSGDSHGFPGDPRPGTLVDGPPGGAGGNAAGAGIFTDQPFGWVVGCTIASNSVQAGIGGIGGRGTCNRYSCANRGASGANGVAVSAGLGANAAGVFLVNSILAFNLGAGNCSELIADGGNNLSSDESLVLLSAQSRTNVNPRLAPLADNGGLTPTMALEPGSPALDAGDNFAALPTDQRGVPRMRAVDIGAYESERPSLAVRWLAPSTVEIGVNGYSETDYPILDSADLRHWSLVQWVHTSASGVGTVTFLTTNSARFIGAGPAQPR